MGGVVAADINAVERRMLVAAIDIAAGDRIAIFPAIRKNGRDVGDALLAITIGKRLEPFINIPAEIFPSSNNGNFFNTILSHIANPQVMSQRIKTESPWLAKTVSPDLGPHIWPVAKW